jgi:polyisoprenoid-binding protein YceI
MGLSQSETEHPQRSRHKLSTTVEMVPVGPYKLALDHSSGWFVIGHSGVAKVRGELDEVDAKLANDVLTGTGNVESVKSPAPGFRTTCRRRTSPPAT